MNSHLFLQYGPHDILIVTLPYAVFWIHQLPEHTQVLFFNFVGCTSPTILFFIILQGIAGATDVSNFLRAFLMGFFKFLILRVNEIDTSQFSCVIQMELFFRPLLLLLQLGILSH